MADVPSWSMLHWHPFAQLAIELYVKYAGPSGSPLSTPWCILVLMLLEYRLRSSLSSYQPSCGDLWVCIRYVDNRITLHLAPPNCSPDFYSDVSSDVSPDVSTDIHGCLQTAPLVFASRIDQRSLLSSQCLNGSARKLLARVESLASQVLASDFLWRAHRAKARRNFGYSRVTSVNRTLLNSGAVHRARVRRLTSDRW